MHSHFVFSEKPVKCGRRMKAILKYKTKTSCMSRNSSKVSNQNKQGMFFRPKFAQNWMFGSEFQKSESGFLIGFSKILLCQFLDKTDNFGFFGPRLRKNELWCQNYEDLSSDSESAPPRYYVCQFLGKTDNFDFLTPNLPKNGFRVVNSGN